MVTSVPAGGVLASSRHPPVDLPALPCDHPVSTVMPDKSEDLVRMASYQDPAALRRRLLLDLRRYRSDAGLTQKDVAQALDWSPSKVIRIEAGNVAVGITDLRALLQQYGVTDAAVVKELEVMAREAKKQSWAEYRDVVSQAAATYFGYEASAMYIRQFEPLLIPGLLQSEEYTRALLEAQRISEDKIDRYVEARLERQTLLDREHPPKMFFVLDEAVIRRRVGGAGVMKRQLQRLEDLGSRPEISIQIMPFAHGAYLGMWGPFILLDLAGPGDPTSLYSDNNVLYLESREDLVSREDSEETGRYIDLFLDLEKNASPRDGLSEVLWAA
jgi:transcriptional regulator with XRE-family HTH domain